jgi:DNA-binding XRE family transcriptional regulator
MGKPRDTERRSELKRCLSKALNTLDRDYGIEVNAERVLMENTSGMNFDTWKNRTVQFAPPASIEGRIFKAEGGDAPPLPNVAGDWTPKQIRHLRTEVIGDTQEEFGEKLHDVTKQYISQLERGTSDPSTRIRKRLDALHSRYS